MGSTVSKLSRSQSCISSASISEAHLIAAQAASSVSLLCPDTYFKRVGHDCAACRLPSHFGYCSYSKLVKVDERPERELPKTALLCGSTLSKSSSPPPALTTTDCFFPGKCWKRLKHERSKRAVLKAQGGTGMSVTPMAGSPQVLQLQEAQNQSMHLQTGALRTAAPAFLPFLP